jgi:hypothetical protein
VRVMAQPGAQSEIIERKTKTTKETNLVDEAFDRLVRARPNFAHAATGKTIF